MDDTVPYVVITDLDGTLLDHFNYGFTAAQPALDLLRARDIPLVLCSSKTAAEIHSLRQRLQNRDPFIVENGAAIFLPVDRQQAYGDMDVISIGMQRSEVIAIADAVKAQLALRYTGFSDMSVSTLVSYTGLDDSSAVQALQREFTEPIVWEDAPDKLGVFIDAVTARGLSVVKGGRFIHLSGQADKGAALVRLREHYALQWHYKPTLIALGDGENDLTMLEKADIAVQVKSPVSDFPPLVHPALYRTHGTGPEGWNEAIQAILAGR